MGQTAPKYGNLSCLQMLLVNSLVMKVLERAKAHSRYVLGIIIGRRNIMIPSQRVF